MEYKEYVVKKGDTLWEIARCHGICLQQLLAANPQIENPDLIYPGQVIYIPVKDEAPCPPGKPPMCDKPYPPLRVECPNRDYARLLHEDYAGAGGEITAIMQYLYHSFACCMRYEETAELLEAIAINEMYHMEVLAKLIVLLGGDPDYTDACGEFWCANNVAYCYCDICRQLMANIEGERAAIAQYRRHMEQINDRYVKAVLARIIEDEEHHLQLLQKAYECECKRRD
ncbi:MAG TPA: LysM peptidoglycan-binding domain-containing protein [Firmicutes bacterium]|nr:LysM peptidoglycan-binding domain-containing protein [Bacillota bacterium]